MLKETASCYCGNVSADLTFSNPLSHYTPRACDCNFCHMHGAAYISDPDGSMQIKIKKRSDSTVFKQGSGLVDLNICTVCGVLVAVTYKSNDRLIGGLNSTTLNNRDRLLAPVPASPKLLSDAEKISRWNEIWFPDVSIVFDGH